MFEITKANDNVGTYMWDIYRIDKAIENIMEDEDSYDPETGEFLAEMRITDLTKSKNELYHDLCIYSLAYSAKAAMIDTEIKRLQALKKSADSKTATIKRMLTNLIPAGEKLDLVDVKISWRKSETVVPDEFLDLHKMYSKYPGLVKRTYELSKTEVKNFKKATGVLPEGVRIVENQNIQIK